MTPKPATRQAASPFRRLPRCGPPVAYNAVMERLNKYLAHAGVGSRRFCDELIAAGRVKVDGVRVTELGVKVDPATLTVA